MTLEVSDSGRIRNMVKKIDRVESRVDLLSTRPINFIRLVIGQDRRSGAKKQNITGARSAILH